jgi:poly-gamma-glutamate synthesis protein (capsule biosynthesis protein)
VLEVPGKGRVLVFAFGISSSGIHVNWAATEERPGVNLLADLSPETVQYIREQVTAVKRSGDIVVVSIHWGANWGYAIPAAHKRFAHQLIDEAGVAVIFGHSSHHVKGLEVYHGQPIIYGAGDFLNDYEGIGGYEDYRADLTLMYFVSVDPETGKLVHLHMVPMQIKHFSLHRAAKADALWLQELLNREGMQLAIRVELQPDHRLTLSWD